MCRTFGSDEDKKSDRTPLVIDEELSMGNFTEFSGIYKNTKGDSFELLDEGNRKGVSEKTIFPDKNLADYLPYTGKDIYSWTIQDLDSKTEQRGFIYPIGVEVPNLETDTNKVRISYGTDTPSEEHKVYYKESK